jgi:SET domain-containing protein
MLLVKTRIGPSRIHGVGCFAEERIRAGQPVWVFDKRIDSRLRITELPSFPKPIQDLLKKYGYEEMYEGHHTLVLCADHARHMNHSDDPNVLDDGSQYDIAARDIEPGEELTCDYYSFDLDAVRKLGSARRRRAVAVP